MTPEQIREMEIAQNTLIDAADSYRIAGLDVKGMVAVLGKAIDLANEPDPEVERHAQIRSLAEKILEEPVPSRSQAKELARLVLEQIGDDDDRCA